MYTSRRRRHYTSDLTPGVRTVAWARTVRWVGWGFGESLLPIFIFIFAGSFAEAGLLRSVFEITLLFALPVVGVLADRVSARWLILVGILAYPFVGIAFLLAGMTGLAVFVLLARFFNALGWAFESTGVDTYYRRMASRSSIASSFGFIDTVAQIGWIAAALLSILLVPFVPMHYLLFFIAPTSIVAFFVAIRAPKDHVQSIEKESKSSLIHSYRLMLEQWRAWGGNLRLLSALVLFTGFIEAILWFFIPIDAYREGVSLPLIILLTIIPSIPFMFGYVIGKIADRANKFILITCALLSVAAVMVMLALFPAYAVKLIASFLLGLLLEVFAVVQKSLVTTLGPSATYGARGGAFSSIGDVGDIAAPLLLGVMLDSIGFPSAVVLVAWVAIALSLAFTAFGFKRRRSLT